MATREVARVDSAASSDQAQTSITPEQRDAAQIVVDMLSGEASWKEIAAEIGVAPSTLRVWRANPEFQSEMVRLSRRSLREHIPTGHSSLIRNVRKGDNQAIKMLFELTGEYQEAKMRDLLGAWMQFLAVAGIPEVRRLLARVQAQQEAGGTGAYVQPPVDDVQDAVVVEDAGGKGKSTHEQARDAFEV